MCYVNWLYVVLCVGSTPWVGARASQDAPITKQQHCFKQLRWWRVRNSGRPRQFVRYRWISPRDVWYFHYFDSYSHQHYGFVEIPIIVHKMNEIFTKVLINFILKLIQGINISIGSFDFDENSVEFDFRCKVTKWNFEVTYSIVHHRNIK